MTAHYSFQSTDPMAMQKNVALRDKLDLVAELLASLRCLAQMTYSWEMIEILEELYSTQDYHRAASRCRAVFGPLDNPRFEDSSYAARYTMYMAVLTLESGPFAKGWQDRPDDYGEATCQDRMRLIEQSAELQMYLLSDRQEGVIERHQTMSKLVGSVLDWAATSSLRNDPFTDYIREWSRNAMRLANLIRYGSTSGNHTEAKAIRPSA